MSNIPTPEDKEDFERWLKPSCEAVKAIRLQALQASLRHLKRDKIGSCDSTEIRTLRAALGVLTRDEIDLHMRVMALGDVGELRPLEKIPEMQPEKRDPVVEVAHNVADDYAQQDMTIHAVSDATFVSVDGYVLKVCT